ncbi:MAG TPA: RNA-directed DNA polymerase [Actinomycetota bacterium]|nr:RNA-directed DNA polymerase [Actinomycetota bacterium]
MEALPARLLTDLELEVAVQEEAAAVRNRVPPEPWRTAVAASTQRVADWVRDSLTGDMRVAPSAVVSARKETYATRPVATMGIAERVTYRALARHVLRDDLPDRSPEAYRAFVQAPITQAWDVAPGELRTFGNARFSHVVISDIAAFYEYIDHDVLARELRIQTGNVLGISFLKALLAESEGRTFGLPQLYDPSDWLSDYYIRIVERDLSRRGFRVWRYNDDFRIACESYAEALEGVERLSDAARTVGLTVSDHKTFTPQFFNYLVANTNVDLIEGAANIDPDEVEVTVRGYVDWDEDEPVEVALATLRRLALPPSDPDRIDLAKTRGAQLLDIRRALATLTNQEHPGGLEWVVRLVEFIPSLTPQAVTYLIAAYGADADRVREQTTKLRHGESVSEWQAMWFVHALRELGFLDSPEAIEWTRTQRDRGRGGLLAAEASLALAESAAITFDQLDIGLRMEPEVLAPWYVLGIKALRGSMNEASVQQTAAIRDTSRLFKILLES